MLFALAFDPFARRDDVVVFICGEVSLLKMDEASVGRICKVRQNFRAQNSEQQHEGIADQRIVVRFRHVYGNAVPLSQRAVK